MHFSTTLLRYPRTQRMTIPRTSEGFSLCDVTQYLQRLCRLPLRYVNPVSLDYDVVIAMYSNYTKEDEGLRDEDHAEVVRQMSEELGCPKGPMWYRDSR
ncbi:uncharacterized protein EV420DRAFT_97038 [Desarmillaria tabescens]|uniref:Uncharacterized protein n=1 Tax=Armillaria tabescens TaxID=1929756 RepID=A0AA39NQZ5_ARMTA|nr:uncharacterized protein EV420DRAFT_97038 [Desarmillaria tabescens]KAK0470208.1 hypothetical protein EV420DRAFT_97038 [Desarmillaria tabescens]